MGILYDNMYDNVTDIEADALEVLYDLCIKVTPDIRKRLHELRHDKTKIDNYKRDLIMKNL